MMCDEYLNKYHRGKVLINDSWIAMVPEVRSLVDALLLVNGVPQSESRASEKNGFRTLIHS